MNELVWKSIEGAKLINNKIGMITGAASGIGRACSRMFAQQGARLVLVDKNYKDLMIVSEEIKAEGYEVYSVEADVTLPENVDNVFEIAYKKFNGLNILINNAGGGTTSDFFDITVDEWKHVVDLNLSSVFLFSQHAARIFKKNGGGVIVNISSLAGRSVSITAGCHYTASKAGVLGLTRHMAKALASYNIRVNAVCPGLINSERIVRKIEAQGKTQSVNESIPLGRIGDVDEVAGCCLFLASDISGYVTGAALDVNGGHLMM